ncbi:MAG: hypothetical protein KC646_16035 [Candidatus Cloacimonetes bacterium]|nr:hypothetical protein [Candidatus Cloacimonadota bacterium]
MEKVKPLLQRVGRFFVFVIVMLIFKLGAKYFESRRMDLNFQKEMQKMVDKVNKDLPSQIDEYTEFYNVSYDKKTLFYFYNLTNSSDLELSQDDIDRFTESLETVEEPATKKEVCSGEMAPLTSKINIKFVYQYDDEKIAHIDVKKGSCKKSK